MNQKIGILYICTGEYYKFWEDFYISCEKHFLKECELHYFLFTDNHNLLAIKDERIHTIYQEKMEWPYPTLLRYKTFVDHKDHFLNVDYLVFCNANLLFIQNISFEELLNNKPMFATLHPGFFDKNVSKFTYESNQESLAFIERNNESIYVCGGFNGGETESFLVMAEMLNNNINTDLENNIIAVWHDESHLNHYVQYNKSLFNILNSGFCYPENRRLPFEMKILVRDKDKLISIKHKGLLYMVKYHFVKYLKSVKNTLMDLAR